MIHEQHAAGIHVLLAGKATGTVVQASTRVPGQAKLTRNTGTQALQGHTRHAWHSHTHGAEAHIAPPLSHLYRCATPSPLCFCCAPALVAQLIPNEVAHAAVAPGTLHAEGSEQAEPAHCSHHRGSNQLGGDH